MKIKLKNIPKIMIQAGKSWWATDPFRQSAIIAYYSIFSLPGLLILVITLAGYFFGREAVAGQVYNQISNTIGENAANTVRDLIAKASETKNSTIATIIGLVTIIAGATAVFAQFQKSLNIIWEVKTDTEKSGIWSVVRVRLFSFGLIISIGFILLASLVLTSLIAALGDWMQSHFPEFLMFLFQAVNFIVSMGIIAVMFALMFKFLPDAKVKWRHVWIGALVTALLFQIGKYGLGLYFGKAHPGAGYGAAASIVLILLWVSYSSMIVFFGAEFTKEYANFIDGAVRPDENSVRNKERKKVRMEE
jgi:membrane protein